MERERTHEPLSPDSMPAPFDLHLEAAAGAVHYSAQIAKGGHLRFPWTDVDAMVGPLLPGWLVLWGARAKHGKSTALREVFNSWVNQGHRVVFVGTEQEAAILKLLWACLRQGMPQTVAFDTADPRHQIVLEDVAKTQAEMCDRAILTADPGLTLDKFTKWCRYAYRMQARALILDHFHRMDCGVGEEQYAAIREMKRIAALSGLVLLVAAQLKQGEGGPLGDHEVPGSSSWAGTANLQRECDVSLQAWKPFKKDLERGDKQAARDDADKLAAIVDAGVMAVRVSGRRYLPPPSADGVEHSVARLRVRDGMLYDWRDW